MDEQPLTWHYGLVARWWAEQNIAEPAEIRYLSDAIQRVGGPALDLGCGAGRLLLPLLASGLVVDGVDISADMIAQVARGVSGTGHSPRLQAAAMHEFELEQRYRIVFMVGAFGIGGHRDHDRLALQRVIEHLEPGGVLLIGHELPYAEQDLTGWGRWLPPHRAALPQQWPTEGMRGPSDHGEQIELVVRLADFDPLLQRQTLDLRALLWRDDVVVAQEEYRLHENLYFAQEILLLLDQVGFSEVRVEGWYTGVAAGPDDAKVVFVAAR